MGAESNSQRSLSRKVINQPAVLVPDSDQQKFPLAPVEAIVFRVKERTKQFSWKTWSFIALAVVPTLLCAIYMTFIAANQYVGEFRFVIRNSNNPMQSTDRSNSMMGMGGPSVDPTVISDSNAVVQFIKSRSVVDELEQQIGLRKIYSSDQADWFSRLNPASSVEEVTNYWRNVVDPFFDLTTGIVTVKVRAFTPADALQVSNTVLKLSEDLVNEQSSRSRRDMVKFAEGELRKAETQLRDAQIAVREFRDKNQVLDPSKLAEASGSLQGKLREELSGLRAQLDSLKNYLAPDSVMLRVLQTRIQAIQDELNSQQSTLTQPNSTSNNQVLSAVLTGYEALQLEQQFREKAYSVALEALRTSRAEAERQQLYLNAFVRPSLPEQSVYPQRLRSIAMVAFIGCLAWIVGLLGIFAVRDHIT